MQIFVNKHKIHPLKHLENVLKIFWNLQLQWVICVSFAIFDYNKLVPFNSQDHKFN